MRIGIPIESVGIVTGIALIGIRMATSWSENFGSFSEYTSIPLSYGGGE